MSPLTSIRAALPTLTSLQALRPDAAGAAGAAGGIRPGALRELTPTFAPTGAPEVGTGSGSFSSLLGRMVAEVSQKQSVAAQTVAGLQSGQPVTLHQAMISMEEASVSFSLMAEVRNKLLESYQELMRMQV
jgi:flagellar hook-basal body complex protein FliE